MPNYEPKITASTTTVLWSCGKCGGSYVMRGRLRSHKLCPECKNAMKIEFTK